MLFVLIPEPIMHFLPLNSHPLRPRKWVDAEQDAVFVPRSVCMVEGRVAQPAGRGGLKPVNYIIRSRQSVLELTNAC